MTARRSYSYLMAPLGLGLAALLVACGGSDDGTVRSNGTGGGGRYHGGQTGSLVPVCGIDRPANAKLTSDGTNLFVVRDDACAGELDLTAYRLLAADGTLVAFDFVPMDAHRHLAVAHRPLPAGAYTIVEGGRPPSASRAVSGAVGAAGAAGVAGIAGAAGAAGTAGATGAAGAAGTTSRGDGDALASAAGSGATVPTVVTEADWVGGVRVPLRVGATTLEGGRSSPGYGARSGTDDGRGDSLSCGVAGMGTVGGANLAWLIGGVVAAAVARRRRRRRR